MPRHIASIHAEVILPSTRPRGLLSTSYTSSSFQWLEIHNSCKLIGIQTRTANKASINITHGHQSINTIRSDATTILNPHALCNLIIIHFGQDRSNIFVHLVGRFSIAYQTSTMMLYWESRSFLPIVRVKKNVVENYWVSAIDSFDFLFHFFCYCLGHRLNAGSVGKLQIN